MGTMIKGRILFVDDDKDTCLAMSECLSDLGFEVDTANNGEEALKLVHTNEYMLVITDMNMPIMTGLELCSRIKRTYNELKVIMLTGCGDLKSALEAMDVGVSNFLLKPIDSNQIDSIVHKTLTAN